MARWNAARRELHRRERRHQGWTEKGLGGPLQLAGSAPAISSHSMTRGSGRSSARSPRPLSDRTPTDIRDLETARRRRSLWPRGSTDCGRRPRIGGCSCTSPASASTVKRCMTPTSVHGAPRRASRFSAAGFRVPERRTRAAGGGGEPQSRPCRRPRPAPVPSRARWVRRGACSPRWGLAAGWSARKHRGRRTTTNRLGQE